MPVSVPVSEAPENHEFAPVCVALWLKSVTEERYIERPVLDSAFSLVIYFIHSINCGDICICVCSVAQSCPTL